MTVCVLVVAHCRLSPISLASPATMEFESVPVGTKYGGPDQTHDAPGDVVLTENGIKMSVEWFFLNQFSGFYWAEVVGPANDHQLAIDNISVMFDLTALPYNVNSFTLQYNELGGSDNFAVNGGSNFQLRQLAEMPTNIAPGVTALVDGGLIKLTGKIDSVLIGGQELTIDTIVAVPEPTSLVLLGAGGVLVWRRLRRAGFVSRNSSR